VTKTAVKKRRCSRITNNDESVFVKTGRQRLPQVQQKQSQSDFVVTKQIGDFKARTEAQEAYIAAMEVAVLTFGVGPAGTGKTRCAAYMAAKAITSGLVERIVCTRPAVEAEEKLGFMPGNLDEKYADWLAPFKIELSKELGESAVEYLQKRKRFIGAPLGRMRGLTFEKSFVVLDEAQNTTRSQMKLFLTRAGEDSIIVVDGDLEQSDIPGPNGLEDALKRLQGCPGTALVKFGYQDIVRSGLVSEIARRYTTL